MNEDQIIEIAKEVAKIIAKEGYGDALKPGMQQVGKAIETVLALGNTVLTPIAMINDKVKHIREKNLLKLDLKLKEIPQEKIITIHPEIAVPVLQRLEYTQNEDLAELFLNLLSTAANIETAHLAHPAFVNIISNLSPDEAKILNYIKIHQNLCHLNIRSDNHDGTFSSYRLGTTILEFEGIITFQENSTIYISNLIGLGLVKEYACPSGNPQVNRLKSFLEEEWGKIKKMEKVKSQHFEKGSYGLTKFGELFLACCTKEN